MAADPATTATDGLLLNAIKEFHWMARRYCDGRMSTAPSSFNTITRDLVASGVDLCAPLFARDGMGRSYDGLTDAEAAAAEADMPQGHAGLEAEWRKRTEALRALLREARDTRAADIAPNGWAARVDEELANER